MVNKDVQTRSCLMHMSDFTCWTSYIAGTYLAENDEIDVTCYVEFGGSWKPEFTCEVAGRKLSLINTSPSISDVTASFRDRAVKELAGSSINCAVKFNAAAKPTSNSSLKVADNIPVYGIQWTSSVLQVTCKYKSVFDRKLTEKNLK